MDNALLAIVSMKHFQIPENSLNLKTFTIGLAKVFAVEIDAAFFNAIGAWFQSLVASLMNVFGVMLSLNCSNDAPLVVLPLSLVPVTKYELFLQVTWSLLTHYTSKIHQTERKNN